MGGMQKGRHALLAFFILVDRKGILTFTREFECLDLTFRPVVVDDAVYLFKSVGSDLFPKSLPLADIKTLKQAREWCLERALEWEEGKCYVWSCRHLNDSQVIGQVTLLPLENCFALAYWISPKCWGKGIATQMCKALLSQVQSSGYQGEIWAGVHSWNHKSASVLKKLGFQERISSSANTVEYRLDITK